MYQKKKFWIQLANIVFYIFFVKFGSLGAFRSVYPSKMNSDCIIDRTIFTEKPLWMVMGCRPLLYKSAQFLQTNKRANNNACILYCVNTFKLCILSLAKKTYWYLTYWSLISVLFFLNSLYLNRIIFRTRWCRSDYLQWVLPIV